MERPSTRADDLSQELSNLILEMMRGIHNRSSGETLNLLYKQNLSLPQLVALHLLDEVPALTIGELAQRLHLSLSATSHLVDTLVEKKLITREEDPLDRRRKHIRITPRGKGLVERIARSRSEEFIRYFEGLPREVQERFRELLLPLVDALRTLSGKTDRTPSEG
jgi:DNA-binding MarR family transcriptional regulator